jgi:hypothetical protein
MSTHPEVQVLPAEYWVSILPRDDINASTWSCQVAYRGRDRWAVVHYGQCLSRDGKWDYERIPSEREDEWLAEHRFSLDEAIERAKQVAPHLRTNGLTAVDVLERIRERGSSE